MRLSVSLTTAFPRVSVLCGTVKMLGPCSPSDDPNLLPFSNSANVVESRSFVSRVDIAFLPGKEPPDVEVIPAVAVVIPVVALVMLFSNML